MEHRTKTSSSTRDILDLCARSVESYQTRIMLSLCASLALLLLAVNVPLNEIAPRVGWAYSPAEDGILLEVTHAEKALRGYDDEKMVATVFQPELEQTAAEATEVDGEETGAAVEEPADFQIARIPVRKVLNFAQQQPEIVGGLTNYYLNIDYPVEAREQGVEGRLLLSFVVEPTGQATDIRIEQPLHPLCDSSAVAALEKTRFVPGRQNGERVAVRMRLPVLFRLINVSETPDEPVLSQSQLQ